MRLNVAAAIALLIGMAATTTSAGVIISENVVTTVNDVQRKTRQTTMVQGNKRKLITADHIEITDLDARKMYLLQEPNKKFMPIALPPKPPVYNKLAQMGVPVPLMKGPGSGKVDGYACQDYSGSRTMGRYIFDRTQCVASDAPGAKEYVAFMKGFVATLKGLPIAPGGEIPDGIPVSSKQTESVIPFPIPKNFPPDLAAKVKESNAKLKPTVTQTTVTKIQVKDIAANEFELPAEFKASPGPTPPIEPGVPGGVQPKPLPSSVKLPGWVSKVLPNGTPAAAPTH